MITCRECFERLYPEDPRIPIGRYHHSTCDYFCNKPSYYRELEENKDEEVKHIFIYEHSNISNRQVARISALENNYSNLKKFVNERSDKKKGKYNKYS